MELRKFGNPAYPKHVTEKLKTYAFKLLIIQVDGARVSRVVFTNDNCSDVNYDKMQHVYWTKNVCLVNIQKEVLL